jgi:hypothetical protein
VLVMLYVVVFALTPTRQLARSGIRQGGRECLESPSIPHVPNAHR